MPIPIIETHCLTPIYSPFSGLPADGDDGPNESDNTLLFVWYGDVGDYAYISERLTDLLNTNVEEIEIESLHETIELDGGIVLKVDTDWNGLNCYGFAPGPETIE